MGSIPIFGGPPPLGPLLRSQPRFAFLSIFVVIDCCRQKEAISLYSQQDGVVDYYY